MELKNADFSHVAESHPNGCKECAIFGIFQIGYQLIPHCLTYKYE